MHILKRKKIEPSKELNSLGYPTAGGSLGGGGGLEALEGGARFPKVWETTALADDWYRTASIPRG